MSEQQNSLIERLVGALEEQTRAIQSLAESNILIIDYLVSQETDGDEDGPAARYMDGSLVRGGA